MLTYLQVTYNTLVARLIHVEYKLLLLLYLLPPEKEGLFLYRRVNQLMGYHYHEKEYETLMQLRQ